MSAPALGATRVVLRSAHLFLAAVKATFVFLATGLRNGPRHREAWELACGRAAVSLCHELGATFIKVGQIASTRADLLPAPLIAELATLRDRVPPFPFHQVREIVETDLGRPLEASFATFEEEPEAAASVAQVHRATLADGTVVAVKVRRPDIAAKVELDRAILLFLGRGLERLVPSLRLIALEGSLRSFCGAVEEQLDLRAEAENNLRFAANFASDPEVRFPRLHPELCAGAVLTMEYVDGVHERDLEASDVDVRGVVESGMRCVCRMIFLHGFVHADLHPGNMRFLAPSTVVLLDLGLVGRLEDEDRLRTARMLFAFATGDGRTVARIFHDSSPHAVPPSYSAYEDELAEFVGALHRRGMSDVQLTLEIGRLFDVLRRHRVQARSHMTMVNLALMTAEGLGKRLAPELSLADEALPYLAEALRAGPAEA